MKLFSRSKGQLAQLKVQIMAMNKNYSCSIPTNAESPYDIIIDNNKGIISRAQIKYCNRKSSRSKNALELALFNTDSKRKHYLKENIDLLLVFLPRCDSILCYEPKFFHRKSRIQINLTNKQSKWYYKKYLW